MAGNVKPITGTNLVQREINRIVIAQDYRAYLILRLAYTRKERGDGCSLRALNAFRVFARAREWTRLLESGAFADVKELAEGLKMDRPYVVRVLRLANLSPKILRAVITKELPDDFSTERLFNIKSDLWSEQEREIGLA